MRRFAFACALALAPFGAVHAEEEAEALGDATRGEQLYRACIGCHQVGEGAQHDKGPSLNDLFGRRAGSMEGFEYSAGLKRAFADGMVWDIEHLNAYLENPKVLVSRTNMDYRGMKKPQDRRDVLAYLRTFSASPQDIPESEPTALAYNVELTPEILAIVGDPEYGEYLASECLTCHQINGDDDGIPGIAYWYEEDFVIAMHAYKQKLRPHPVMQMMAGRLSDEEIAALAAYFANLE
ncbi:Cytochrome c2 [Pelagimonas phthalicica]|uniref:Cytochrome c2 n=1 Tax=Pelagimonas phthalicica TaxID=1037362 RepID=A0A238JJC9_9RHOB|nr:c-type cytochrome [Pelagimonas phthalicica]TDS90136.1 sulfide dehydrogenase (flavocytochrome c) cytochrome c subunit [Pelagimonas phthalicica]SMX30304.1 Cytochrome c2 [Pelagimonas phthalicica]